MGRIFDAMVKFFKEDEWPFQQVEDKPLLRTGFSGKSGKWLCFAQAREEAEQFLFYSICPFRAPPERRKEVMEFLTRANYGMIIGNFEMDLEDGEIRYKTAVDVESSQLTQTMLKNMVYINVKMMDKYLPGIKAVAEAGASPKEEIKRIEG